MALATLKPRTAPGRSIFELATEQLSGSQFDVIFRVVNDDGTQVLSANAWP
jgi:hypothetical protein